MSDETLEEVALEEEARGGAGEGRGGGEEAGGGGDVARGAADDAVTGGDGLGDAEASWAKRESSSFKAESLSESEVSCCGGRRMRVECRENGEGGLDGGFVGQMTLFGCRLQTALFVPAG